MFKSTMKHIDQYVEMENIPKDEVWVFVTLDWRYSGWDGPDDLRFAVYIKSRNMAIGSGASERRHKNETEARRDAMNIAADSFMFRESGITTARYFYRETGTRENYKENVALFHSIKMKYTEPTPRLE